MERSAEAETQAPEDFSHAEKGQPVVAVVRLPVQPGRMALALAAVGENIAASHQEPGVIKLALHREREQPDVLWIVEVYRDQAALDAHMRAPHLTKVVAQLPDFVAGAVSSGLACPVIFASDPKGSLAPLPGARRASSTAAGQLPYVVIATFPVVETQFDRALELLKEDALPTYDEPGVLKFAAHRRREEPNRLVVVEAYRDKAALDAHYQTPHLAKIAAELPPLLAGEMSVTHVEPIPVGDPAKGIL